MIIAIRSNSIDHSRDGTRVLHCVGVTVEVYREVVTTVTSTLSRVVAGAAS